MYCKNCGNEVSPSALRCSRCGAKLDNKSNKHREWISRIFYWIYESENSKRNLIIIGISALIISILFSFFSAWGDSISIWIKIGSFLLCFFVWCIELYLVIPFIIGLLLDIFLVVYWIFNKEV